MAQSASPLKNLGEEGLRPRNQSGKPDKPYSLCYALYDAGGCKIHALASHTRRVIWRHNVQDYAKLHNCIILPARASQLWNLGEEGLRPQYQSGKPDKPYSLCCAMFIHYTSHSSN